MGCIPSKEPNSQTPLIKTSGESSTKDHQSSRRKPQIKRRNTLDRLDTNHESYDDLGNYKYKKWCGVRRSTCLLTLYIGFYAAYILFGAIVMMVLEEDNLSNLKQEAVKFKQDFVKRNSVNETELEKFIEDVLTLQSSGVSLLKKDLEKTEWAFGESILFVVTTLTTIGNK